MNLHSRQSYLDNFGSFLINSGVFLCAQLRYCVKWNCGWTIFLGLALSLQALSQPPRRLSQTGLYKDHLSKRINPNNLEFSPNFALWTDGAEKKRWYYLPKNSVINTQAMDQWIFPVGTKLWKEFAYQDPKSGKIHRVETRYFKKISETEWEYASYAWLPNQKDAILAPSKGIKNIYPIPHSKLSHSIPSRKECLMCHQGSQDQVLGFQAIQLSGPTLQSLIDTQRLSHPPQTLPRLISSTPQGKRAMGYLHANCGHCHSTQPTATAHATSVHLNYLIEGTQFETDLPVFKTAVGKDEIVPGSPQTSEIIEFMLDKRMPKIGNEIVDLQGVEILSDWISVLKK